MYDNALTLNQLMNVVIGVEAVCKNFKHINTKLFKIKMNLVTGKLQLKSKNEIAIKRLC